MGRTIDRILENIDLLSYMEKSGYTPVPIGSCYTLKEHDSIRIFPQSNTYFHSSRDNRRLNVINFVEWHEGISNKEAIKKLAIELNAAPTTKRGQRESEQKKQPESPQPVKLELPEKTGEQYRHVYAYLEKTRGISRTVIQDITGRKMLYEDTRRNATFVSYYPDGSPGFCFQRGTGQGTPFKKIIPGSDFSHGWYLGNGAKKLFVTEAVIDSLSVMSLMEIHGFQYQSYDYLATCGTSMKSVIRQVKNHPEINTVYLAFDNDLAGHGYRNKARTALYESGFQGKILDKPPVTKDFNLDLQAMRSQAEQKNQIQNKKEIGRIIP